MLCCFTVIKKYLLLEKGLNFAVTPYAISHSEFVSSVEKGLQNVKNVDKVALAISKIAQILKNFKLPPKNITTAEVQVLKELRSDPIKKIINSDKGNAIVILDSNTYDKKMLDMLLDPEVYSSISLNSNPISTIQKEVNQILNQFAKDQKIAVSVYSHLKCDKGVTSKMYGLPKIHQESDPLRPIVSFVGSPLYNLSKFLIDIFLPIVNLEFCVKNSSQFIHKISRVKLNPDECMVSFDVVSLFMSVPINEVKILIFDLLSKDRNLCKRTKLTVQDTLFGIVF